MELMNLKPSFARKLNQRGFSPIYLALQEKQEKMVDDLLSIDKDLVRVKGREGYTPLHHAVREGNVLLLSKFLENCPNSIFDLTIRKETALHIAAQNNNLEAFEAILNLNQGGFSPLHLASRYPETVMVVDDLLSIDKDLVRVKGREGYTPLHYAAREGDAPLLLKFLEHCPNCILDLTIRKQTALHVAAQYN
ncbi:Ankyrin repeat - like 1, partial [Theobroma cacao]